MAVAPVLTLAERGVRHFENSKLGGAEPLPMATTEAAQFRISEVPDPAVAKPVEDIGLIEPTRPIGPMSPLRPSSAIEEGAPIAVPSADSTASSDAWSRERIANNVQPLLPKIVGVWLLGVSVLSARMLWGWFGVRRLRKQAQQSARAALQELFARLLERLAISKPVRLVESALVEVPTVIGWLKPIVLLPATAMSGLSTEQLEALLAHELAHVRRNDYLINLLQSVIETLLFYHPAVWWLSRRIRIEREHCCDDLAVQVCGDELSYAKALVALEELRGPQVSLAMSADGGSLLQRVRRLMSRSSGIEGRSSWTPSLLLLGVLIAVATTISSMSATKSEAAEKTYSQRVPPGTTVELVALCKVTDAGEVWWSPNGTVIAKPKLDFGKDHVPPKNLIGVVHRWNNLPEPERYEVNVFGEVKDVESVEGRGEYSSDGGKWIEYFKPGAKATTSVTIKVSERAPELAYGSPGDEVSHREVVFENVSLEAGQQTEVKVRLDESGNTLAMKIRRAASEFFGGHMLVDRENVVDRADPFIKGEPDLQKALGRFGWQSDGQKWRIDFESHNATTNTKQLRAETWSTGFDGEQLFQWERDANRLTIGSVQDHCQQYEPRNLFWNSVGGGLEGFLKAVSMKTVKTTATQLNGLDGLRLEATSEKNPSWKWSAFVCPSRGYLPLEVQQLYDGRVSWECKLSDLVEVRKDIWAPRTIQRANYLYANDGHRLALSDERMTVKLIEADSKAVGWQMGNHSIVGYGGSHRLDPREDPSPFEHDFTKQGIDLGNVSRHVKYPNYGVEVVDLSRGASYFNDPWWQTLEPELKAKFSWRPRPLESLLRLQSNFSAPPSDQPLTVLPGLPKTVNGDCDDDCRGDSFQWLSKSKLDWKQLEGKVTLIVFWNCWNSESVATFTALNRLHETYEPHGLKILAVHRPRYADYASHITDESKAQFAVVIDAENESGEGELHDALKVRGMPTGLFLDHQRKVIAIPNGTLITQQIGELLTAAGAKDVPVIRIPEVLPDEVGRAAEAAWKEKFAKAEPQTQVIGRVLNENKIPMGGGRIEVVPKLKLARGGYGGLTVYPNPEATIISNTSVAGTIDLTTLKKGCYEIRILPGLGYATSTFEVAIGKGQSVDLGDIVANKITSITGRIVDQDGQSLVNAQVDVMWRYINPLMIDERSRTPGSMPRAKTDKDGMFRLEPLERGFFKLRFDAVGHQPTVLDLVRIQTTPLKVWLDRYPEPLQAKVTLHEARVSLQDAIKALCEQAKVKHELDGESLKSRGLTKNMPVTVDVDNVPLGDALEAVLAKYDEELSFAWDGQQVVVSLPDIVAKRRMPQFVETVKGPARERFAQAAAEQAVKDLAAGERQNRIKAGSVSPLELKKLKQMIDATQAEHELVLHEASQVLGQSITPEFLQKSNELLIKRVETFLALNKTLLDIANESNEKQPGSVSDVEVQRLKKQILDLEQDLQRLLGKPAAKSKSSSVGAAAVPLKGRLRGVVKIEGNVPKMPPIPIYDRSRNYPWRLKAPRPEDVANFEAERAKNPAKFDPRKARDESVLIGNNGGIANTFVFLQKALVGWQPTPIPTQPMVLRTEAERFVPRAFLMLAKQPLTLSAAGLKVSDNFHFGSVTNQAFNIIVAPGKTESAPAASVQHVEKLPRIIRSDIFPQKRAHVLLLDHPFAAITDADGRFDMDIEKLPPGTHSFIVWHEHVGYFERALSVKVSADEATPLLSLSYPVDKLKVHRATGYKNALDHASLELFVDWAGINNEFTLKSGEPSPAKFEFSLRNTSDKPVTVQIPEGSWTLRRELKVRELHVKLEPAADAKLVPLEVPPHESVRVPLAVDSLDLSGVEPGYWQVWLQSPLHQQLPHLTMWIDVE